MALLDLKDSFDPLTAQHVLRAWIKGSIINVIIWLDQMVTDENELANEFPECDPLFDQNLELILKDIDIKLILVASIDRTSLLRWFESHEY